MKLVDEESRLMNSIAQARTVADGHKQSLILDTLAWWRFLLLAQGGSV
jgi:hypothetical protein